MRQRTIPQLSTQQLESATRAIKEIETIFTTHITRDRLIIRGVGVALAALLFILVSVSANPTARATSITWSTTLTSGDETGGDEFGYEYGSFGSLTDRTFEYDGVTYSIEYLKWDESSEEIEFELDKCLKSSAFVSLTIGSTTYSSPDYTRYRDSSCESDSTRDQEFEFQNLASNPLTAGSDYQITVALVGLSTPPPSSSNTWTTTLTSEDEICHDEFGNEADDFGSLYDTTFVYD